MLQIVTKKYRPATRQEEWVLVSREARRPLKWFGLRRPSPSTIAREERRVQFFKHRR